MRNAWLVLLLLLCGVASGLVLARGRAGGEAPAGARAEAEAAQPEAGPPDEERSEPAAAAPAARAPATFYRYTDATGTLRFVRSLAEVPAALRSSAQPVSKGVQRAEARARPSRDARAPAYERAAPHEVVVYTTSWCGWCRKTLAFLREQGVDFENRDIEADEAWREELREKTGGTSIPVVEIDGQIIRGYNPQRMAQLLRSS